MAEAMLNEYAPAEPSPALLLIVRPIRAGDGRYRDAVIEFANQPWRTNFGCADRDLRGQTLLQAVPAYAERMELFARVFETGEPVFLIRPMAGDTTRTFDLQITREGECVVLVGREITREQELENALRKTAERLKLAQEVAQLGSWSMDWKENLLVWSDELYHLFETDPETEGPLGPDNFQRRIHPDEREMIDTTIRQQPTYVIPCRMLFPEGRIKYLELRGQTCFAEDGSKVRSIGTVQDVSRRKRIEQKLEESEARLRNILDNLPIPVACIKAGPEEEIFFVNDLFVSTFGYTREEVPTVFEWARKVYPDPAYLAQVRQA